MGKILLGVGLATGITAVLDALGYSVFSALPLIPLFALFAWYDRMARKEIGLIISQFRYYGLALAHPLLVIAALAMAAKANGALDLTALDASRALKNVALMSGATFIMAIITEEGFFRGWLWAALSRRGATPLATLLASTAAFVLWHVPFVFLSSEFHFAAADIPIFFVNATLLGLIWGLIRLGSGSIIVSSAGHGMWNGMTYVLFGVGSGVGALGIEDVGTYGPEVGIFGAALNAALAGLLFWLLRQKFTSGVKTELGAA